MKYNGAHLTRVVLNLDHLTHNMALLQEHVGNRMLWPAVKANGYGHGAKVIGRHLVKLGYRTLCVAHVSEAIELIDSGLKAKIVVLSPALPESSECFAEYGFEPVICTLDMVKGLSIAASKTGREIAMHLKIDTGMGRVGIRPDEVVDFLDRCRDYPGVFVKGMMSHFPCADESDKDFSMRQIDIFRKVKETSKRYGIRVYHLANSGDI